MDVEYYYKYLKEFLIIYNDYRKDDDEFIRDRAEYALRVFEAESKIGTVEPNEVAKKVLMECLDYGQEEHEADEIRQEAEKMSSRFSDAGLKYYQVREHGNQYMLIQYNPENVEPSVPRRLDANDPKDKAVVDGSKWCLDRCVGYVRITKKGCP